MSGTYGKVTPKMQPIATLDLALDRTREFLFRPFNFTRWISLGVIIFLESLVMGGGCSTSGNYNTDTTDSNGIPTADDLREFADQAATFVQENIVLVASIAAGILLTILAFTVLFAWLGSRGQLMFIRAVATGDHRIGNNWSETRALSTSLFQFRLILGLVGTFFSLIFVVIGLVMTVNLLEDFEATTFAMALAYWMPMLLFILVGLLGVATLLTISLLLRDFVAPFMYHFNVTCLVAWSMFGGLVWGNIWRLHVFYFMRMMIGIAGAFIGFFAGCLTCCIGFFPVLRQTILAPIYVFDRAYSLHVIASMGPEYQMIHALAPPPAPDYAPPPLPDTNTDDISIDDAPEDDILDDEYPPE